MPSGISVANQVTSAYPEEGNLKKILEILSFQHKSLYFHWRGTIFIGLEPTIK
jgi:hypothetical protein